MIARINAKAEKALREAIGGVPDAEADQIDAPLAVLNEVERTEAIFLSTLVACYVIVDACGTQWPDDANIRQFAHSLATVGTTARRLQLGDGEIYQYLSRTALGPEPLQDVIPDYAEAMRLAIVVAQRAVVVYSPEEMEWWVYLDRIESAIETAMALDTAVLPAAVMRAYLPRPSDD
jgi:hypothetical protein